MPVSAEDWEFVRLTDDGADDSLSGGVITADGNRIVFISDTDENPVTRWDREVFMYDLQTKQTVRITSNVYEDSKPVISGDGSKIAFVEYRSGRSFVYAVSESNGWQQSSPLYSSDGAISLLLSRDGNVLLVFEYGEGKVTRINTASGTVMGTVNLPYDTSIYGYYDVIGSSGGSKFAVVTSQCANCPQNVKLLYTTTAQGAGVYTTENSEYIVLPPHASDDGKVVLYMESESYTGRKGIFVYQNGNLMQIVNDQHVYPAISADGSRIYYVKSAGGQNGWEIFAVKPDGSEVEKIYSPGLARISLPLVSEDGSVLVFRGKNYGEDYEIYLLTKKTSITGLGTIKVEFVPMYPSLTTVKLGSARASAGDVVQIPVEVAKASNLGSINLVVTYPSDSIEAVEVIQGSLTENSLFDYNVENGKIRVGISDAAGMSGDGSLFYIRFKIIEDKESSEKRRIMGDMQGIVDFNGNVHSISVEEYDVYDVDGNRINPVIVDGTIEVVSEEEANKGDVNGDGFVNSLDALLALQMSVGKINPKPVADMDGDGKVLAKDATEIMKLAATNMMEQVKTAIESGIQMGVNR
ncbi:cohesin domain-containing protein [Geoglobus sp.]